MFTLAPLVINAFIGSNELFYLKDFRDYIKANVPNIVFFPFTYSPQEIRKFQGFVSARCDASHKSMIWDLARLLSAAFIISCFSSSLGAGAYFCNKLIIAVDPFFDAINRGDLPSLSFVCRICFILFRAYFS